MKKLFRPLLAALLACTALLTACGAKPQTEQAPADTSPQQTQTETKDEVKEEVKVEEKEEEPTAPTKEELEAQRQAALAAEAERRAAMPIPEKSDYVFDEDNIVVTFGAFADTHLRVAGSKNDYTNDNLNAAISFLREVSNDGLDALFLAGDLTDSGLSGQVSSFAAGLGDLNIPVMFATGNHDQLNSAMTSYMQKSLSEAAFGSDIDTDNNAPYCRHSVVGGIHFIQVSANSYYKGQPSYTEELINWLASRLEIAAADAPGMPIFVSTHLPISNSVFGSNAVSAAYPTLVWASEELKATLDRYPQVVLMSGHTHYPHVAENSIVQDGFTMVNVGTLKHTVVDYWFANSTDTLTGSRYHPGGMLVEVDANGGVRMTRYDFGSKVAIDDTWILPPASHEDFLSVYTYGRANSVNTFPTKDLAVESVPGGSSTSRTLRLTFSSADSSDNRVYYYQVDIQADNSTEVKTLKYISDFAFAPQAEDMQARWTIDVEKISIGASYTITVTPYSVWNMPGESQTVTIDLK